MYTWEITDLDLKLKYEWKIARNASSFKHNLLVTLQSDGIQGIGEVAPNVRYGENADLLKQQFQSILPLLKQNDQLKPIEFADFISKLPIGNALKNGIETAYIHLYCIQNKLSVETLLGISAHQSQTKTSYTLPIMPSENIGGFIKEYDLEKFSSLKIKVSKDTAIDLVKETLLHYKGPVRIDGNETWNNELEVLAFMNAVPLERIEFIEQPLPEQCISEYIKLKKTSPLPILLDESITDKPNFEQLTEQCHGINMKMMKAGGYYNGLRILQEAQKNNLQTMIGCMIETTLGIFSAINLSNGINYLDLDGFFVIENDPFNMVKEEKGELIVNKKLF